MGSRVRFQQGPLRVSYVNQHYGNSWSVGDGTYEYRDSSALQGIVVGFYDDGVVVMWTTTRYSSDVGRNFGVAVTQIQPESRNVESALSNTESEYLSYDTYPLHKAAKKGDIAGISYFASLGADLNSLDQQDFTPLELARYYNQKDAADYLVSLGAKPDSSFEDLIDHSNLDNVRGGDISTTNERSTSIFTNALESSDGYEPGFIDLTHLSVSEM